MTQKEPKESARYILEEMTELYQAIEVQQDEMDQFRKDYTHRQFIATITSKHFIVNLAEFYNILQDKTYVLILERNEYTYHLYMELIQMNDMKLVISIIDDYIKRGYTLHNLDYKKYLSHDNL